MAGPWGRNHLLLLSLLSTFSFKETKCKSLINLDFSPSWRREISQRASDYGTLIVFVFAGDMTGFKAKPNSVIITQWTLRFHCVCNF